MITIVLTNANALIVSVPENIIQHSKNVHTVRFFVPETYNTFSMADFSCSVELVPPNQSYKVIPLTPEEISAKEGYIQYNLDIISDYTIFSGDIEMQLTFVHTDENGKTYIRHTESCSLPVIAIKKWSELITDDALSDLDQRLVLIENGITTASTILDSINTNKADNLALNEDGDLQLKSYDNFIGDAVSVAIPGETDDDDDSPDGIYDLDSVYEI